MMSQRLSGLSRNIVDPSASNSKIRKRFIFSYVPIWGGAKTILLRSLPPDIVLKCTRNWVRTHALTAIIKNEVACLSRSTELEQPANRRKSGSKSIITSKLPNVILQSLDAKS